MTDSLAKLRLKPTSKPLGISCSKPIFFLLVQKEKLAKRKRTPRSHRAGEGSQRTRHHFGASGVNDPTASVHLHRN